LTLVGCALRVHKTQNRAVGFFFFFFFFFFLPGVFFVKRLVADNFKAPRKIQAIGFLLLFFLFLVSEVPDGPLAEPAAARHRDTKEHAEREARDVARALELGLRRDPEQLMPLALRRDPPDDRGRHAVRVCGAARILVIGCDLETAAPLDGVGGRGSAVERIDELVELEQAKECKRDQWREDNGLGQRHEPRRAPEQRKDERVRPGRHDVGGAVGRGSALNTVAVFFL
jgi:hypothetical protein